MILVIGDIIVDEYIWGSVRRISPEAPVPVVEVNRTDRRLGGSANVVNNLHALGESSAMFGIVGDDEAGRWVVEQLQKEGADTRGVIPKRNNRPTAIKTRVIAQHQQVVRFDREWVQPILPDTHREMMQQLEPLLGCADAVILSDYGKGVLNRGTLPGLIEMLRSAGKIVGVDPKPSHTASYRGASFITPNLSEGAAMAGLAPINEDDFAEAVARQLHADLALQMVLLTRSERGMTLFDGTEVHHIPTAARDVFDVSGAGDTVIATFTACLAKGMTPLESAKVANRAAGVVVGKLGTATATWAEIEAH